MHDASIFLDTLTNCGSMVPPLALRIRGWEAMIMGAALADVPIVNEGMAPRFFGDTYRRQDMGDGLSEITVLVSRRNGLVEQVVFTLPTIILPDRKHYCMRKNCLRRFGLM